MNKCHDCHLEPMFYNEDQMCEECCKQCKCVQIQRICNRFPSIPMSTNAMSISTFCQTVESYIESEIHKTTPYSIKSASQHVWDRHGSRTLDTDASKFIKPISQETVEKLVMALDLSNLRASPRGFTSYSTGTIEMPFTVGSQGEKYQYNSQVMSTQNKL